MRTFPLLASELSVIFRIAHLVRVLFSTLVDADLIADKRKKVSELHKKVRDNVGKSVSRIFDKYAKDKVITMDSFKQLVKDFLAELHKTGYAPADVNSHVGDEKMSVTDVRFPPRPSRRPGCLLLRALSRRACLRLVPEILKQHVETLKDVAESLMNDIGAAGGSSDRTFKDEMNECLFRIELIRMRLEDHLKHSDTIA
jgi:hypothetical protein